MLEDEFDDTEVSVPFACVAFSSSSLPVVTSLSFG
jgi:hypothetical protein